MRSFRGTLVAVKPSVPNMMRIMLVPDLSGLIDAMAKSGTFVSAESALAGAGPDSGDFAGAAGAVAGAVCAGCSRPKANGPARASRAAVPSSNFLRALSLWTPAPDRMRATRLLRSAPVTPDAHNDGDSTQNRQVISRLSA